MKAKPKQEQDPKIWEIKGLNLAFDVNDLDDAEKLDSALDEMLSTAEALKESGSYVAAIRGSMEMYMAFFRKLFPEDAEKLLSDLPAKNLKPYEDMYICFLEFIQMNSNRRIERLNRFRPAGRKK